MFGVDVDRFGARSAAVAAEQAHGNHHRLGDDGLTRDHPYVSRAADPVVADCPVLWPWHVVGPDEPATRDYGSRMLVLEYDLDVYEVWPGGPCSGPLGTCMAQRDRPLDVVSARMVGELRGLPGTLLVLSGGWSPSKVSRRLEDWARACANRADVRFHWNPGQHSSVLTTFARYCQQPVFASGSSGRWAILQPAQAVGPLEGEPEPDAATRKQRKHLRIADARRWARRMKVDPDLAWLTPAEVRMFADLDPVEEVGAWAARHHVPTSEGRGLEPVFAAATVLRLVES